MKYPFLDLKIVNAPWLEKLKELSASVIDSGRYIGGPEVTTFEKKLAQSTGSEYAVGCANGLDAVRLIFRALIETGRLRKGDEVIVTSNTYIASILGVTDCGLRPLFVEPDISTMNLSGEGIARAMTPDTKAVLTVHLYGRPAYDAEMERIVREKGLILVEDNAQAIGATAFNGKSTGSLGTAAAFSFYPTKNIGALGDAGAITTDDKELADTIRALGNYGSDSRYHNIFQGLNSRLDPLQATFLSLKMHDLDKENMRRREIAAVYETEIINPAVIKPAFDEPGHVWHQYVVRIKDRDKFRKYLSEEGVGTDVHYPTPPHRQPCYREYSNMTLPIADILSQEVVSLPISACTSVADAKEIARIINSYQVNTVAK